MDELEKKIYHPMQLSDRGIKQVRTPDEYRQLWKKYLSLPKEEQDILTDEQLPLQLKTLQSNFGLPDSHLWSMSIMVRKIFFNELNLAQAEAKIGSLLAQAGGDFNKAKEIVQFIDREILHLVPKPAIEEENDLGEEGAVRDKTLRAPLLRAMTDYPSLGFQQISGTKIRLKGQAEPQRPTLSNWIKCYRDELGVGFHNEVQRGRFLFQSENGRRLSQEERDRLNLILKSIEEDFPLEIDTAKQTIVFPTTTASGGSVTGRPGSAAGGNMMSSPATTAGRPGTPPLATSLASPSFNIQPGMQAKRPPSFAPGAPTAGKSLFNTFGSAPGKNVANETLHFSTGHVMPAEQGRATPPTATPPVSPAPLQPTKPAPPRNPYVIRPLRLRNDRDEGK